MELNEMLGFVIAVIGIVLLGFFGVKLYGFFVDSEMKNAQAFIDDLNGKINTLKEGESNSFALRGIEGWILVAWNKEVPIALDGEVIGKNAKPQKCFDKDNCLCICDSSIERCQEAGYCRAIDGDVSILSIGSTNAIQTPSLLYDCIYLEEILNPISVTKMQEQTKIILDYGVIEDKTRFNKIREGLELCRPKDA